MSASGRVAVVTDSTCCLPQPLLADSGALVVPLRVSIGDREGIEGVDIAPADVAAALAQRATVRTSRPSPGQFAIAYRSLLDAGASNVVSVHLSARLSGTWDSARLAAQDFPFGAVRVVDSRSTGMALGFAVLAAAAAAAAGRSAAAVQDAAVATVDRTSTFLYVDTLEFLRRGGRIGAASALLATSLSVKPLLHVINGRIEALAKVRTASKAVARLVTLTVEAASDGPVDVAVQHLAAAQRADWVAGQLRERLPLLGELYTCEIGAAVGAHLGPGMVGTVVVRR